MVSSDRLLGELQTIIRTTVTLRAAGWFPVWLVIVVAIQAVQKRYFTLFPHGSIEQRDNYCDLTIHNSLDSDDCFCKLMQEASLMGTTLTHKIKTR